jgi:DNA-binding MarR family transcriptional regulator
VQTYIYSNGGIKMMENNNELIVKLTRVEWLLHRHHLKNHMHFGPMGDSRRGQGRILAILKLQQEISQKDLTFLLDMRPQSLGELLFKLERNGYITRTPSETDRRVMNIKLTEEGIKATEATEQQEDKFDKLFECLSEEEQRNLSNYLDRIIESLESHFGGEQSEDDFIPQPPRPLPFEGPLGRDDRHPFGKHFGHGHGPGHMHREHVYQEHERGEHIHRDYRHEEHMHKEHKHGEHMHGGYAYEGRKREAHRNKEHAYREPEDREYSE